jgi:hypothetical protein
MRRRARHPRLVRAACACYGVVILLYPGGFRRTFGRELMLTFRSRVEDVLDAGGIGDWVAFAAHIAWDTARTTVGLLATADTRVSTSLLGLCEGEVAHGGIEPAGVDVHLLLVTAGLGLALGGWYAYFVVLPTYMS